MSPLSQPPQLPLVLLIDQTPEVLSSVSDLLIRAGYACHACASAETALAFTQVHSPDIILCDVSLHDGSGPELCQKIKEGASREYLPVMYFSGTQTPDIIRRSGATYSLRKPLDPDVLLELIDQALDLSRIPVPMPACQQFAATP
jgi:two-component system chemotaxis response regulator CheY